MTSTKEKYRRRAGSLEWHYMADCRKYPTDNVILSTPKDWIPQSMVCPICRRLEMEENGMLDNRKSMNNSVGILSWLFG